MGNTDYKAWEREVVAASARDWCRTRGITLECVESLAATLTEHGGCPDALAAVEDLAEGLRQALSAEFPK